jgi:hypothetical protein
LVRGYGGICGGGGGLPERAAVDRSSANTTPQARAVVLMPETLLPERHRSTSVRGRLPTVSVSQLDWTSC